MVNVEELLEKTGGILKGHFLLTSGNHSDIYFEKFRLIEDPQILVQLCSVIADKFRNYDIDYIVGPTTGGAIIAYEVARQMSKKFLIAEKRDDKRVFARGVSPKSGDRCLVVDDVLTTGGSFMDTVDCVKESGGVVVGGSVLIDRSNGFSTDFDFYPLYKTVANIYSPNNCPLCKEGVPLVRPGGKR